MVVTAAPIDRRPFREIDDRQLQDHGAGRQALFDLFHKGDPAVKLSLGGGIFGHHGRIGLIPDTASQEQQAEAGDGESPRQPPTTRPRSSNQVRSKAMPKKAKKPR